MIDMAQAEKGFYSKPKHDDYEYQLINDETGDILATYDKRPRTNVLENLCDFWGDDRYRLKIVVKL